MSESFNKPFRRPEEDLKIRNFGSFTEQEIAEIINDYADFVTENHSNNNENSLDLKEQFGEDITEKMAFVIEEAVAYFHSVGIDSVKFNRVFYSHGNLDENAGSSNRNQGTFITFAEIENIEIRQLRFLKTLAHELYHSTAMISFTVTDSLDEETNHITRTVHKQEGASYQPKGDDFLPQALEEGLAARFEMTAFEKIRHLYSKEIVSEYDDFIENAYSQVNQAESDRIDIAVKKLTANSTGEYMTQGYAPARRLISFLEKHIPEFDTLIENARLKRHTLPLARVIEDTFGKDAYRMITTAEVSDSDNLINHLTRRLG
jgi:hypothetical protein